METATLTSLEALKALYDAFANGNIPYILDHMPEHFTWHDPSNPSIVPYGGKFKGKAGMLEFFQQLGGSTETTLWEVNEYIAEDNRIAAIGRHGITCKKTGKKAISDFVMIWHFENDEPVAGRSYYNNADTENAFR